MKRLLSIFLALALIITVVSVTPAKEYTPGDFGWRTDAGSDFTGWTSTYDGIFTAKKTEVKDDTNRIIKEFFTDKNNFKFKVTVTSPTNDSHFEIRLLGYSINVRTGGGTGHQFYVDDLQTWVEAADGEMGIVLTRTGGGNINAEFMGKNNDNISSYSFAARDEDHPEVELKIHTGVVTFKDAALCVESPSLKASELEFTGMAYSVSDLFNNYDPDTMVSISDILLQPGTYKITLGTKSGYVFSKNGDHIFNVTIKKPAAGSVEDITLSMGATIGSTLTMNFYAVPSESYKALYNDYKMEVALGDSSPVFLTSIKGDGYYRFNFANIFSQRYSDKISGKILGIKSNGESVVVKSFSNIISVKDYCDLVASAYSEDDGLITFLSNMLELGAESQKFTGWNSSNLANNLSWVSDNKTSLTPTSKITDAEISVKHISSSNKISSVGLFITNKISIYFDTFLPAASSPKIVVRSPKTVKAEYNLSLDKYGYYDNVELITTNTFRITLDALSPLEYDNIYTIDLYDGETKIQTVKYSVNTYFTRKTSDPSIGSFVKAAYNYGVYSGAFNSDFTSAISSLSNNDSDYYFKLASIAISDQINNFWDKTNNKAKAADIWHAAQYLYGLYDMWVITGDDYYKNMLKGEASFIKSNFSYSALTTAGGDQNWATDDCFWNCMVYLMMYKVSGDTWFLDVTEALLDSANARWGDSVTGGGMWYNDDRNRKSMYEVGAAISWYELYKITGKTKFYNLSLESYEWMYQSMGATRSDGLYFCEVNTDEPVGYDRKNDINEAGSVSFLTANMGMAALSVIFYNETKDIKYMDRALKTCEGLAGVYNNNGVLINDRDAWTNGAFASYFASYVLTLDNSKVSAIRELCKNTAGSIITKARTTEGYYGGSWNGPGEGILSRWHKGGSTCNQITTSSTSVSMITSMAIYESNITNYLR